MVAILNYALGLKFRNQDLDHCDCVVFLGRTLSFTDPLFTHVEYIYVGTSTFLGQLVKHAIKEKLHGLAPKLKSLISMKYYKKQIRQIMLRMALYWS